MTTARDIMTEGAECARPTDTLVDVARKMRDLEVGALPICGEDDHLRGMITDRDIVTQCVASGSDPHAVNVEEYVSDETVTIGADDSVDEALRTMMDHGVRRLPVIDGADDRIGDLVAAISKAPSN
jgi:CBS domain-containing protein